jgi:hypothetical protein
LHARGYDIPRVSRTSEYPFTCWKCIIVDVDLENILCMVFLT